MDNNVLMALISFAGTFAGTLGGIIASNKLTSYRLEQLEKKGGEAQQCGGSGIYSRKGQGCI